MEANFIVNCPVIALKNEKNPIQVQLVLRDNFVNFFISYFCHISYKNNNIVLNVVSIWRRNISLFTIKSFNLYCLRLKGFFLNNIFNFYTV